MSVVAVALFGVVSLDRLAVNLLPEISYPSLTIQTDFPDAAPEEVEALITRLVEEAVGVVPGLKRMSSVSRSGQSEVVLEFAWDVNMDLTTMDVREKLDTINFHEDAEKPIILRFDPSYDPIMRVQIYGELSLSRLRYLADQEIRKGIESAEGVAAVKVMGGHEEQIHIEVDEKRLAELSIPITDVTRLVQQANLNRASGSLYDLDASYLVRLLNEFRSVREIENLIVRDEEGRRILLGDVARVYRGPKERDIIARLDGQESVEMAIYKEGDANTVAVSSAVRARLDSLMKSDSIPSGTKYEIVFDQARFIQESVNNVLTAAVAGGLLAIIILFVFLRDLRSTVIIALSIPISILATLALMYQTGISLNIMSLGGIALGVGMLVDNSIVVLESVHRHKEDGGAIWEIVYRGTTEVGRAVTASTLTTIAVFLPMVFVEGIAGQLFKDQALTITYSLLASLIVALTFIPMALAVQVNRPERPSSASLLSGQDSAESGRLKRVWKRVMRGGGRFSQFVFTEVPVVLMVDLRRLAGAIGRAMLKVLNPGLEFVASRFERLNQSYPRVLTWSLDHKGSVFVVVFLLVLISIPVYYRLGAELIPPLAQGEFSFEIELPKGTPLEYTDRIMADLENQVKEVPGVETVFSTVGGSNKNQFANRALEEHMGQLYVVMAGRQDKEGEFEAILKIREALQQYPEIAYTFARPTLFSFKNPIEVEIYTYEVADQHALSELVAARLATINGLSDIQMTAELGNPEIQVRLDRMKLARLGLHEDQIAGVLRNKIRGDVASRYREEEKLIDILVRARESDRQTISDIRNLVVNASASRQPTNASGTNNRTGSLLDGSSAAPASATFQSSADSNADQFGPNNNRLQTTATEKVVPIRLGAVADVVVERGPSEIRHIRSQRAAVVSGNLAGRDLNSVSAEIQEELQEIRRQIPADTIVTLGGQNEEFEASYRSLVFSLALAIFLVYLVMASQFESFVQPFIIMFTVPLALAGIILSLFVTGTTINVMVLLGGIILAGIVVNNAIVLIDYANQLRGQGLPRRDALLQAGQVRLRPIVMTTLTTLIGLFPMALGWGEGAEVRAPMAIAVMGGLLFATLLTLVLIPVVYEVVTREVIE